MDPAFSTLSSHRTETAKEHHNSISFHALRAKFHSNNDRNRKSSPSSVVSMNKEEPITRKKKCHSASGTMPRRFSVAAKNISDLTDHFTLMRASSNNSSFHDLSSSKITPSLVSNNSTIITTTDYDEEDEEEELLSLEEESMAAARSKTALAIRAVPRTGSFVTELSKRLAQSEKKGEPVSQIIPASIRSMRRSVPILEQHHPVLAAPPISSLPTASSMHHLANGRKSVPTSSSSPSLITPAMKRSTTGTSVHSLASSCNSSISTSRSNWHFTQWFTHHPPLPTSFNITSNMQEDNTTVQSPPLVRSSSHDTIKRARVIQELILTEKNYQADMELVQEIYYDTAIASDYFSKLEIKQIFINLLEIIAFEKDFSTVLEEACLEDDEEVTIGTVFSTMMHRMEQIYGEYCKKHEDAVCKLQESSTRPLVQSFLSSCKEKMQGRTTCWDLSSLLIKPVQRVLKYPLLLKEIVALTPETHPDYEQLVIVTIEIQQVADHINEIKRRKDMVEQMINDKKKMVQGINKKFTRRVHRKKQSSATHDVQFDDLYKQFVMKQEMVRQFEKGVQCWAVQIRENNQCLSDLVNSLDSVYGDSDGIGLRSIRVFKKLVSQLAVYPVEAKLHGAVTKRIESYLKLFKHPAQVIQKRNRKLIDYDRARHLISKGEIPDKQLQVSAEAYISLNAHLLDELPTFLTLAGNYFDIIIDEFAQLQAQYWRQHKLEWKSLTIEQPFGIDYEWNMIQTDYQNSMKRLEPRINSIMIKVHQQKLQEKETFFLEKIPSVSSFLDDDQLSLQFSAPTASPLLSLRSKNSTTSSNKYDSLFSDSQPVFKCVALVDYESPEKLQVHEGDVLQIWLPTITSDKSTGKKSSSSISTATESTAATTEWWYGSVANKQDVEDSPVYGWLPSNICEKI